MHVKYMYVCKINCLINAATFTKNTRCTRARHVVGVSMTALLSSALTIPFCLYIETICSSF